VTDEIHNALAIVVCLIFSYSKTMIDKSENRKIKSWRWTEFGAGERSVYLYYFPSHKAHAQSLSQPIWACKIGETGEDVHPYIEKQINKVRPLLKIDDNEYPEIPIIFKTDDSRTLERRIHRILKAFDRWIKIPKQLEWYLTNPDEVIQIYLFIQDFETFV